MSPGCLTTCVRTHTAKSTSHLECFALETYWMEVLTLVKETVEVYNQLITNLLVFCITREFSAKFYSWFLFEKQFQVNQHELKIKQYFSQYECCRYSFFARCPASLLYSICCFFTCRSSCRKLGTKPY